MDANKVRQYFSTLLLILIEKIQTFMSPVSGLALRARLISILPLIFVARSTNRECTDIASNEWFTIHCRANTITTDLAGMTTQVLQGFPLRAHNVPNKSETQ